MNGKRDCKNCIHKVPVFDEEEGVWRGAECDSWECNFVSREEALKAYEGRPQGQWIKHRTIMHDGEYYCSNCDEVAEWIDGGWQSLSNYCPNCGAQMKNGGST